MLPIGTRAGKSNVQASCECELQGHRSKRLPRRTHSSIALCLHGKTAHRRSNLSGNWMSLLTDRFTFRIGKCCAGTLFNCSVSRIPTSCLGRSRVWVSLARRTAFTRIVKRLVIRFVSESQQGHKDRATDHVRVVRAKFTFNGKIYWNSVDPSAQLGQ